MTSNTTTRRTVMRSAAWTAPAVVVAGSAPALAASPDPCEPQPVTIDWDSGNYRRISDRAGVYTIVLPDGSTETLNITSTFSAMDPGSPSPNADSPRDDNYAITTFPIGGPDGEPGLTFHQSDFRYTNRPRNSRVTDGYQDITFTFSREVQSVNFAVTDLDWLEKDFRDAVVPSDNLQATPSNGVRIADSRWAGTVYEGAYLKPTPGLTDNDDASSNVQLTGGPMTRFTLRYLNADRTFNQHPDRDQKIFITDLQVGITPADC